MSSFSAHPEQLLLALDERLDHEVRLIIYGRSAVWLGFDNPPAAAATTHDVDAIIPTDQVQPLADDMGFWDARDAVNEPSKPRAFTSPICFRRAKSSSGAIGSATLCR